MNTGQQLTLFFVKKVVLLLMKKVDINNCATFLEVLY